MTDLERAYGRLLRLYPADYRRARGAEMLDVLLSAAEPGRRRPALREQGALVLGALRIRAKAAGRRTTWGSWQVALRAAALTLVLGCVPYLGRDLFDPTVGGRPEVAAMLALLAAAVVLAWRQRFLLAAITTAMAAGLDGVVTGGGQNWRFAVYLLPAVAFLGLLVGRGPVAARPTLLAVLLPLTLLPRLPGYVAYWTLMGSDVTFPLSWVLTLSVPVVAAVWSLVDERVTMAYGLHHLGLVVFLAVSPRVLYGFDPESVPLYPDLMLIVGPLLAAGMAAVLARHRSRV
ncbi:hypothetical protein EV385_0869 [Krasilnikovia cinnamomea]|uniref:Uncharacterized protein n=1 Tax=Krasilnikovia cinnamomea TaxID=349313 RepID=A0A4Q7ZFM3_9ACTN|nr:hypothetical protein [Krasilnikovia cinnamomea]RZU49134.1 hypothetical protein EV385_0869 [Krasilnikovia cinnamomea]